MAKMTANGVVYDVANSPFTCQRHGIEYRFSSGKHMAKFMRDVFKREEWLSDSLSRRFKVEFDATLVADLQWYAMVETRGYSIRILDSGEELTCPPLLSGRLES